MADSTGGHDADHDGDCAALCRYRGFSGRLRNNSLEEQQQARFKPPARIRVEHQMRAEFGERLAIAVEGLHGRQTPPQRENAERSARLPGRLIPALAVEPLSLEIHAIRVTLPGDGHPEPGGSSEFGCSGILLAEIDAVHERVGQNLCGQEITGLATEMIPYGFAFKEPIRQIDEIG